MLKEGLKGH